MKRHHLIEEAKSDLTVAHDEVRRTEGRVMELEEDYDLRLKCLGYDRGGVADADFRDLMREKERFQEALNLDDVYVIRQRAADRFCTVASAFAVAEAIDDAALAADTLRKLLFSGADYRSKKIVIDRMLRDFSQLVKADPGEDPEAATQAVRTAWGRVEALLNDTVGAA
ncbi:MAG: hypothetical protein AAF869_12080 [Pseudomonadota bacterium]